MSKALLAVYDSSKDYVDRFLDYIKKKHYLPFESIGFTDTKALESYLVRNKVDLLLYSREEFVEEIESSEPECEQFIRHENVREFAYLGKRRNSKSRVNHINKYQSMKAILEEVRIILNEDNYFDEERETKKINVVGIYGVLPLSVGSGVGTSGGYTPGTLGIGLGLKRISLLLKYAIIQTP